MLFTIMKYTIIAHTLGNDDLLTFTLGFSIDLHSIVLAVLLLFLHREAVAAFYIGVKNFFLDLFGQFFTY